MLQPPDQCQAAWQLLWAAWAPPRPLKEPGRRYRGPCRRPQSQCPADSPARCARATCQRNQHRQPTIVWFGLAAMPALDSCFLFRLRSFEKILDRLAGPHEVSFRLPNSTIRERADPKGAEGGGGRRIPATQSRTQVRTRLAQSRTQVRTRLWIAARRPARKSARGSAEPHAGPHAATQARTQPGRGHGDSTAAHGQVELPPPRLWKLTGCGKLRATGHPSPGPSHNRWKSRPPSTAPGFPQLRTASATKGQRGRRKPQSPLLYITNPGARRDGSLPATHASSAAVG